MSQRGRAWNRFAKQVNDHIETYTVPQYGDAGEDIATDYTPEYCLSQVEKYCKRFGRNARPGEQSRDFIKMAHYIQLAAEKYEGGDAMT